MKDLMDYPLTISRIQKDYPGFEFSSDVQDQTSFRQLRPVLNWLNAQGIEMSIVEGQIEATKHAIMVSFGLLENRYLKQLIY